MVIEGKKITVNKSAEEIFNFLSDFSNFEGLMPENVTKFEADETSFIFGIKGMPEVRLRKKSETEFSQIILEAASSKLPVELIASFSENADNTEVQLTIDGSFNPMIKMMVQKPLTNFITSLTDNISKI